jgi:hypothetical protein
VSSRPIRYYQNALTRCAWLIAVLATAANGILEWLNPVLEWISVQLGLNQQLAPYVGRLALSIGVIGGLFLLCEKTIRETLWRLAYPELDLNGIWSGETTYNRRHIDAAGGTSPFTPFSRNNDVLLKQDCLGISVGATKAPGPDEVGAWYSLAAELSDDKEGPVVQYLYYVNYGDMEGFPHEAKGYEALRVLNSTAGVRPAHVHGEFAHCAQGQIPVYSGTVKFERIAPPSAPGFWRRAGMAFLTFIARRLRPL